MFNFLSVLSGSVVCHLLWVSWRLMGKYLLWFTEWETCADRWWAGLMCFFFVSWVSIGWFHSECGQTHECIDHTGWEEKTSGSSTSCWFWIWQTDLCCHLVSEQQTTLSDAAECRTFVTGWITTKIYGLFYHKHFNIDIWNQCRFLILKHSCLRRNLTKCSDELCVDEAERSILLQSEDVITTTEHVNTWRSSAWTSFSSFSQFKQHH